MHSIKKERNYVDELIKMKFGIDLFNLNTVQRLAVHYATNPKYELVFMSMTSLKAFTFSTLTRLLENWNDEYPENKRKFSKRKILSILDMFRTIGFVERYVVELKKVKDAHIYFFPDIEESVLEKVKVINQLVPQTQTKEPVKGYSLLNSFAHLFDDEENEFSLGQIIEPLSKNLQYRAVHSKLLQIFKLHNYHFTSTEGDVKKYIENFMLYPVIKISELTKIKSNGKTATTLKSNGKTATTLKSNVKTATTLK